MFIFLFDYFIIKNKLMNSLGGREWEVYNFDNYAGSTEYDNLLINKDIDNYFNDIINKPIISQSNTNPIKSGGGLSKFYSDYIEHNLIFIVVLVGIIIFLVIRYYVKDFDNPELEESKINSSNNSDKTNKFDKSDKSDKSDKQQIEIKKINERILNKSKKLELEKLRLINYKRELDKEKQQILSIIDELSNINEYENKKHNQMYLNQDINSIYSNNFNNYNNLNNYNQQQFIETSTKAHNENKIISNIDNHKDDMMDYYNINKIPDNKTNEIDGLYIEPPFM